MIDTLGEGIDALSGNVITSDEFSIRFPQLDGQQMMRYFDRKRVLGDMAANAWLAELWEDG